MGKATKIELMLDMEEEQVLQQIKDIFRQENRIGVEQYNKELEQADAEIEAGNYLTHEEATNEIRSWRED